MRYSRNAKASTDINVPRPNGALVRSGGPVLAGETSRIPTRRLKEKITRRRGSHPSEKVVPARACPSSRAPPSDLGLGRACGGCWPRSREILLSRPVGTALVEARLETFRPSDPVKEFMNLPMCDRYEPTLPLRVGPVRSVTSRGLAAMHQHPRDETALDSERRRTTNLARAESRASLEAHDGRLPFFGRLGLATDDGRYSLRKSI